VSVKRKIIARSPNDSWLTFFENGNDDDVADNGDVGRREEMSMSVVVKLVSSVAIFAKTLVHLLSHYTWLGLAAGLGTPSPQMTWLRYFTLTFLRLANASQQRDANAFLLGYTECNATD
jgi:hypothetical protein